MIDPFEIIHADNWAALCIAILSRAPVTPEVAAQLYEHGTIGRPGAKGCGQVTIDTITNLHNAGHSWSKITQMTGIKSPASLVYHWRLKHERKHESKGAKVS